MIHNPHNPVARLPRHLPLAFQLLTQAHRIRPRDRQARDRRDVQRALCARRVRVGGRAGRRGVPGVEREVLDAAALDGRRVARGALGIGRVPVCGGDGAVVARVRVDEDG